MTEAPIRSIEWAEGTGMTRQGCTRRPTAMPCSPRRQPPLRLDDGLLVAEFTVAGRAARQDRLKRSLDGVELFKLCRDPVTDHL